MEQRTLEDMLIMDHEDGALSDNLAQLLLPLVRDALCEQLAKLPRVHSELPTGLAEILEAVREVEIAHDVLHEKREKAQQLVLKWLEGKKVNLPLLEQRRAAGA